MNLLSFPGLGLDFEVNRVAINILGKDIYWYGVIIALGFLLAAVYCYRKTRAFGVDPDTFLDMLLFAVPASIIGARIYYVIFYMDLYRLPDGGFDLMAMVSFWDGGMAIYGSIIAALITLTIFCKVRHVKFLPFADVGVYGLLIGQAIGRWGNFFNIEAYGSETTLPWRMRIFDWSSMTYAEVHPTFLYECLWNVLGFILLVVIAKKWRKFDGQIFLTYVAWYGVGRAVIESLRTDSLYFFGLTFFGAPIRTSQLVGIASALVAGGVLAYCLLRKTYTPDDLYVNQVRQPVAETEETVAEITEEEGQEGQDDADIGR